MSDTPSRVSPSATETDGITCEFCGHSEEHHDDKTLSCNAPECEVCKAGRIPSDPERTVRQFAEYLKSNYDELQREHFSDAADEFLAGRSPSSPVPSSETTKSAITIEFAQYINTRRARRWHGEGGVMKWTGLEWAGAMCGEAGEAANVAKKLRRVEQELEGNQHSERVLEATALVPALGRELADTFFYMLLLAERYEIDLTASIRDAFNKKSEEMGFPERL